MRAIIEEWIETCSLEELIREGASAELTSAIEFPLGALQTFIQTTLLSHPQVQQLAIRLEDMYFAALGATLLCRVPRLRPRTSRREDVAGLGKQIYNAN